LITQALTIYEDVVNDSVTLIILCIYLILNSLIFRMQIIMGAETSKWTISIFNIISYFIV